jgi:hypothetical protein
MHTTGKGGVYFNLTVAVTVTGSTITITTGNTKETDTPNKTANVEMTTGF